jgi:hypothetical protein
MEFVRSAKSTITKLIIPVCRIIVQMAKLSIKRDVVRPAKLILIQVLMQKVAFLIHARGINILMKMENA